jgi:hypothetical protein
MDAMADYPCVAAVGIAPVFVAVRRVALSVGAELTLAKEF